MSEFRIHHDVNELLSLLRVHGGDGAEVYIDLLQKNRTPYVTTTVSAHSAKVGSVPGAALCPGRGGPRPGASCALGEAGPVLVLRCAQSSPASCLSSHSITSVDGRQCLLKAFLGPSIVLDSVLLMIPHGSSCNSPCCADE